MLTIKNGIIVDTVLGIEHGLETFCIQIDFGGFFQSYGLYKLGDLWTHRTIFGILKVLKVEKWESLRGTPVRVKINDGRCIVAIGHYLTDQWFSMESVKESIEGMSIK